jgi:hypothetical protein
MNIEHRLLVLFVNKKHTRTLNGEYKYILDPQLEVMVDCKKDLGTVETNIRDFVYVCVVC